MASFALQKPANSRHVSFALQQRALQLRDAESGNTIELDLHAMSLPAEEPREHEQADEQTNEQANSQTHGLINERTSDYASEQLSARTNDRTGNHTGVTPANVGDYRMLQAPEGYLTDPVDATASSSSLLFHTLRTGHLRGSTAQERLSRAIRQV